MSAPQVAPETAETVARMVDLTISYRAGRQRVVVVDGLDLTIARGETVGLVGESGSGKSTAARTLLAGLRRGSTIDTGSVTVGETDVFALRGAQIQRLRGGRVALVAQNAGQALTPSMRIGAQIAESLTAHGLPAPSERLIELARLVRLPDPETILERWPHQLSGGQQQRVGIAMAIATDPDLLVLDEPTTALDVITQAAILALIDELQRRLGMAVLIVSHDLGVISAVADRVLVMRNGRVVESGPVAAVMDSPSSEYTAALLAAAPRVRPRPDAPAPTDTPSATDAPSPTDDPSPTGAPSPADDAEAAPTAGVPAPLVLRCTDMVIRYPGAPRPAVRSVDLDLRRGETVAVVGESGSGKSTVATALAGLTPAESGTAILTLDDGPFDLLAQRRRPREVRRLVQMIFQNADLALNPRRTIGDSIARPMRFFGRCSRREANERVAQLLTEVGLPASMAGRVPGQLSGGQRQRVGIARALAAEPAILVADEVTTALDVSVQAEVLDLLDNLRRTRNLAMVFISHDLAVVRRIADRVIVLESGVVVENAPTNALFDDPRHAYTKLLLDAVVEPGGAPPTATAVDVPAVSIAGVLVDVGGGHLVRRTELSE